VTPLPFLLRRLRELGALSPSVEPTLVREGILTLTDFELAVGERRASVGAEGLRAAVSMVSAERGSLTLGRASDVVDAFCAALTAGCPDLLDVDVSGEVRRFEQLPRELLVAGRSTHPPGAIESIASLPAVMGVLHRTGRRAIVVFQGHEIDVRVATPDEYGTLLFTTTGPAAHVVEIHRRRGPRMSASEDELYSQAGLNYLPPELRGAPDAIEAAVGGRVPRLVTRADIRGDLHMHTTFSDGQNSVREMVHSCAALGYEYIAISDHSEHAAASRTLTMDLLERQREEIARLRDEYPRLAILHGIEADILPDGSLDCPDDILASLDVVLASLHERCGHDAKRLTARCLQAVRHPLVTIITHPANQLVGRRAGYDMDYAAIYEAAAETGTALEIDGAPGHLDLDGEHAREAVTRGVTVTIDSDCHRARSLERQMQLGIGTARRGWVEPRHVLNTRPLREVRAFVAQKRA
jgi:DNA polymerase (family 10)